MRTTVWACGYGLDGELGNGTFYTDFPYEPGIPVQVGLDLPIGTTVASIAAGGNHSLAVASDGTVWAWGDGSYGELGNGTLSDSATPVMVTGLPSGAIAVAGGLVSALALIQPSFSSLEALTTQILDDLPPDAVQQSQWLLSLPVLLHNAQAHVTQGNGRGNGTCGNLNAFVSNVNLALQNGQLSVDQANELISAANAVMTAQGCSP